MVGQSGKLGNRLHERVWQRVNETSTPMSHKQWREGPERSYSGGLQPSIFTYSRSVTTLPP